MGFEKSGNGSLGQGIFNNKTSPAEHHADARVAFGKVDHFFYTIWGELIVLEQELDVFSVRGSDCSVPVVDHPGCYGIQDSHWKWTLGSLATDKGQGIVCRTAVGDHDLLH